MLMSERSGTKPKENDDISLEKEAVSQFNLDKAP